MMNIGIVIILCVLSIFSGYLIGSWKEGKAVSKAIDDLSAMHYKEIQLIVDKVLALRNESKGGE